MVPCSILDDPMVPKNANREKQKIKGSLYYSNGKKISRRLRLGFEVIHSFTYNALSG